MRKLSMMLGVWAISTVASAALRCPPPAGASPALEQLPAQARLTFLQHRLERERDPARSWTVGWGLGYGALAAAQLAAIPAVASGDQVDLYVGGIASAIAMVPLVATPLDTLEVAGPPSLEARGCAALAEQEARFFHAARTESDGRSLLLHGINVAYNLAAGLVLGLGFGHWVSGAISAAVGIVIGEAQIWTQPVALVSAAERYQRGTLDEPTAGAASLQLHGSARGVSLTFAF